MDWATCIDQVGLIIGSLFAPVVVAAIMAALRTALPGGQGVKDERALAGGDSGDGGPPGGVLPFFQQVMSPGLWWLRMMICAAVAAVAWILAVTVGSDPVHSWSLGVAAGAGSLLVAALLQGAPSG